jgi:hypothetical protein
MLFVYVIVAIVLLAVYNGVSYYVIDFWRNYLILKKMKVKIPVNTLVVFLFLAFALYNLFYLLTVIYTFVSLE